MEGQSSGIPPSAKKVTRRWFLKTGLGLAGGAFASATNVDKVLAPPPPPSEAIPEELPEEEDRERIGFQENGLRIYTKSGLPVRWENNRGESGVFDQHYIQELREQSVAEQQSHVVAFVRNGEVIQDPPDFPLINKEKPMINTALEGILSPEELLMRGIEIVHDENHELMLRSRIFEPGGLLDQFQENSSNRLLIVISDHNQITPNAFVR